ncbi:MAG: hypothetical protein ACFB0G_11125 [Leptolyngbyaceae cyanobacterium]
MPIHTPTEDLSWRGQLYPAGVASEIPNDLAQILGVMETPRPLPTPPATQESVSQPRALVIINEGSTPEELAVLPTIGKGAGKAILEARPEDGYGSLSELPEAIFAPPYNCDLTQIEAYEG